MQRRRLAGWLAVFLALAAAGPAGALEIDLKYDAPESRAAGGLAVAVTFENARPTGEGGDEISRVCTVRSLAGIPWELHTAEEHVDTVIPRYIADALRAAGYDARVGADPALPTVHVVLDELWCAGHVHYETYIDVKLRIYPAGSSAVAWEYTLALHEGVTLNWGFKEMAEGFERVFHTGFGLLATQFGGTAFQQALSGPPAAVAEAALPAVVPADGGPADGGSAAGGPGAASAADIVGLYYVYQGTTADSTRLAAGVEAALALFGEGLGEEALRRAVVRAHQEIPGARIAAFEVIVPPYARAHGADLGGGGSAPRVVATPDPVTEPSVPDNAVTETEPPPRTESVVTPDPEMPDVLPDPEMPDVLPDPDQPSYPTVVEDDPRAEPEPDVRAQDEETTFGRTDRVADKTVKIRGPAKPIARGARAAMGLGGGALLGGGMLGGALIAVACSNASGFDDPGGIPALGLVPLAGPAIVYGYWTSYGTYRYVKSYEGAAALMTALEITGVALIVLSLALPRAPAGVTARRTTLRDVMMVPSFTPRAGGVQLTGRF